MTRSCSRELISASTIAVLGYMYLEEQDSEAADMLDAVLDLRVGTYGRRAIRQSLLLLAGWNEWFVVQLGGAMGSDSTKHGSPTVRGGLNSH